MHYDYRDAPPKLNHLAIEAVIRALYGQERLIDGASAEDQCHAQLPAIVKAAYQPPEMRERFNYYPGGAEAIAVRWQSED